MCSIISEKQIQSVFIPMNTRPDNVEQSTDYDFHINFIAFFWVVLEKSEYLQKLPVNLCENRMPNINDPNMMGNVAMVSNQHKTLFVIFK